MLGQIGYDKQGRHLRHVVSPSNHGWARETRGRSGDLDGGTSSLLADDCSTHGYKPVSRNRSLTPPFGALPTIYLSASAYFVGFSLHLSSVRVLHYPTLHEPHTVIPRPLQRDPIG
jgi:hypothetical protein